MKVLLVFPPVSPQFYMPYLSVPALGAYLRREEPSWDVRMMDLNIELGRKVLEPQNIKRFISAFGEQAENNPNEGARKWFADQLANLKKIEKFFLKYSGNWRETSRTADPTTRWFIDSQLKRAEIWLNTVLIDEVNVELRSQEDTIKWADSYPEGVMTEYFRETVAPKIISFNPDLIGLSWIDHGQIIPSLVLLRILKEKGFKTRVVVGGPYVALIWDRLAGSPLRPIIDHFVNRQQGEEPLLRLARSVSRGEPPESIGQFIEPKDPDISKLPPPDFSDFPLDSYLSSNLRLCLLGSWGCYWGDCSFCNVRSLEGISYRPRKPEQIVEDMAAVKARFKPDQIRLSDNAIPFSVLVKIAEKLIEKDVRLAWITNTRFDGKWTKEGMELIAKSYCSQLLFGLESAAEDVMRLVNKGTNLDLVREILACIEPTPVWAHFYMIVGYPSETREDWERTIAFFQDISRRFPRLRFSTHLAGFGLQIQSPMYRDPANYRIGDIVRPSPAGWSTLCSYKVTEPYTNLLMEPGVFEEMKTRLDNVWQSHLKRQTPLKQRIKNRLLTARLQVNTFLRQRT